MKVRSAPRRGLLPKAGILAAIIGAALASVAGAAASDAKRGVVAPPTETITIRQHANGEPYFQVAGDGTVDRGAKLRIVNETDPQQIGPHTFSLVTRQSRPKTRREAGQCERLERGTICRAIARWHQVDFQTLDVGRDSVGAGRPGWDRLGTRHHRKGDSWFTDEEGSHQQRVVSARRGKTLYFICAVHPFMQGQIEVNP